MSFLGLLVFTTGRKQLDKPSFFFLDDSLLPARTVLNRSMVERRAEPAALQRSSRAVTDSRNRPVDESAAMTCAREVFYHPPGARDHH